MIAFRRTFRPPRCLFNNCYWILGPRPISISRSTSGGGEEIWDIVAELFVWVIRRYFIFAFMSA